MKNLIYLLPASALILFLFLRFMPEGDSQNGIHFFEGTWQQALEKSAAENRPIFLDVYATWCGPCKLLKRTTFSNKKVGDYFNNHFINVEVNGESAEGEMLASKFNIRAYPSLFIINNQGTPLAATEGYYSPSALIQFGKDYGK